MTSPQATLYTGRGAELYHEIVQSDSSELLEIIHSLRGKNPRVLELAAGSGRITLPLLPFVSAITAVDNSAELLAILREQLRRPELRANKAKVHTLLADILRLKLHEKFDYVVFGTTSICLFDPQQRLSLLANIRRWLVPGGELLISLRIPELGEAGSYVHQVSSHLSIEETFNAADRTFTSTLIEQSFGGQVTGDYSVTTHLLTEDELMSELDEAGFVVTGAAEVGPRNRTSAIGSYRLIKAQVQVPSFLEGEADE